MSELLEDCFADILQRKKTRKDGDVMASWIIVVGVLVFLLAQPETRKAIKDVWCWWKKEKKKKRTSSQ